MKNKMTKTLGQLSRVANYMETFGAEYLLINSVLVAHYGEKGLTVYDSKDVRKVARCHETLVNWDNYRNNKVFLSDNVMNIVK
jgi:hypothetical protein